MNLASKKVLITGASDGIGRCIAISLSTESPDLVLLGRNSERLEKVKKECGDAGANSVVVYAFDLSDRSVKTESLEKIREEHGDLAVVINNAGVWLEPDQIDTYTHDQIRQIIEVNLTAPLEVTNTLLPVLRSQEEAAIINISSQSGVLEQDGQTVYSGSKWGMRGFTRILHNDLADTNVHVSGVYQAGTDTEMFKKAGDDRSTEPFTEPEDLADIIKFMLTRPERCWLTEVHVRTH